MRKKRNNHVNRCWSFLLASAMILTSAPGSMGMMAMAAGTTDATVASATTRAGGAIQEIAEDAAGSVDFNADWQFYLATRTPEINENYATGGLKDAGDYTTEEIAAADFNDSSWRTVDVPHDFSIEGEKLSNAQRSQGYLEGGLAYYRKKFTVPASMKDTKTISIDFEGVYQCSVVYLNGKEIGSYPSGYTGFALDITDDINYGGENVLVVKVQNMSPSSRWYTGSGITRPVHLVIDELAHFNRNGITLTTPTLESTYTSSKSGFLNVEAEGYSDAGNAVVMMETSVYDADGKLVSSKTTDPVEINPSTAFSISMSGRDAVEVSNVNLWYPWNLGDPYLYTVKVDLYMEENGSDEGYKLVDSEEIDFGFRWIEIQETTSDPTTGGLYVNGEYTKVQGVDLHHDSGALGAVSYTDSYERQFDKLMDMGVNAYRTSHCPPSKQVIEVCSQKGILVLEEAFDGWGKTKAKYDFGHFFFIEVPEDWAGLKPNGYTSVPKSNTSYSGAKYVWSDWVINEMVSRDKNETCVFAWSIGNEVRGCGTAPDWYDPAQYDPLGVDPTGINEYTEAVRLLNDVDAADGTRFVAMGGDQERTVPEADDTWGLINQVLDGYGLNYNTAKSVDGLISRFSIGEGTLKENGNKAFFFESESSSQTSSRGVYFDPQFTNTGINQTPGSRGGANYDNDFASWTMSNEYGLKKDRDRKSFIGQFIWIGFDYLGEPTPYSVYPVGLSSFGTIDTAGFPKDSFYLYQSQWTSDPMVHLVPQNWDEWKEGETVTVWVNTNLQSAELFLNGKSLGKKSFDEKETAYGKKYYETSEKTDDDKSWGDEENPGGYSSPGAVLDEGELDSGRLHLTWEVPYEAGTLEVKAYNADGSVAATDSVTTSDTAYTVIAEANKTVLAADGESLSYVECTVVDENGNMVPDAANLVRFSVEGAVSIVGVDNGQQENAELYKYGNVEKSNYSERSAYNGKVLVILKSEKTAGDAMLTIWADDLKPVQVALKVTEDGTGTAAQAPEITGTAASVDAVSVSVPAGVETELPAAVKVNYTSSAGDYSIMRRVTWGNIANGKAEGTIEGCSLKAQATIKEDASLKMDEELATNAALGKNNDTFSFDNLEGEAADGALATATFTGSTKNYPNNMLDGDESTSWTNAYSRGASVLLPANSASRKSEYVQFYWNSAKVFNQITLSFVESEYCAIPSVLEVEYWNGDAWTAVSGQKMQKLSGLPVIIQFDPVYTEKVRVYMENATPYTSEGNMEITEASVMMSTATFNAAILIEAEDVAPNKTAAITLKFANLPSAKLVKEVQFAVSCDSSVFTDVAVKLKDGVEGTLTSAEAEGKVIYTYVNEKGIPANIEAFAEISAKVSLDAAAGSYEITLTDAAAKDVDGNAVNMDAAVSRITVTEPQGVDAALVLLQDALKAAEELEEKNYTIDTWQAFSKAREEAKAVYSNAQATEEQVRAQVEALTAAAEALKIPDVEDYQKLAEELKKVQEELNSVKAELENLKNSAATGIKKGDSVVVNGVKYQVIDAENKLAAACGVESKTVKTVKVAATVKISGVTCKVTAVSNKAFAGMKKLTKVVIGKNVISIGAKAFKGDAKLKNITVKSKVLTSVGKNALKGIAAKAVIKVPSAKKKAYTSLFKGKGQKKTVKVK